MAAQLIDGNALARQVRADPHGEEVAADDRGKLENGVAEQIAAQRAGDQFVGQSAGGDRENGDDQQALHQAARLCATVRIDDGSFTMIGIE